MKRYIASVLTIIILLSFLLSCSSQTANPGGSAEKTLRLASFVGVWTDEEENYYYRFTPSGLWFYYNRVGQIEGRGTVEFDGKVFTLVEEDGRVEKLKVDGDRILDSHDVSYQRTDSPSSLIAAVEYESYFTDWYEESDLLGNVLTVSEPDAWVLKSNEGEVLYSGSFYAYADEPECLYLYQGEEGAFFACLTQRENSLVMKKNEGDQTREILYDLAENSTERYFYFKDKGITCDYVLNSGFRLLRNGGAAYNDAHDYKKMPVTCSINAVSDQLNEAGERELVLNVTYEFKRTDLPYLSGGVFYNSVLFSQYDYYTGQIFKLGNFTGNESIASQWISEHDGASYLIACEFSSAWEYFQSGDVLAQFVGTYHLTMPADYDGFVLCLRPVFNSYSAQVSSIVSPAEGSLVIEDVGSDVEKSIFCRVPRFSEPIDSEEAE